MPVFLEADKNVRPPERGGNPSTVQPLPFGSRLFSLRKRMLHKKSEPGRVAPVIPGRHGPALRRKRDIYYLTLNKLSTAHCPLFFYRRRWDVTFLSAFVGAEFGPDRQVFGYFPGLLDGKIELAY